MGNTANPMGSVLLPVLPDTHSNIPLEKLKQENSEAELIERQQ